MTHKQILISLILLSCAFICFIIYSWTAKFSKFNDNFNKDFKFNSDITKIKEENCMVSCGKLWTNATFFNFNPSFKTDQSVCNEEVTKRGPNQKVISFSFYGDIHHARKYFEGIEGNVELARKLYPGWLVRVYHDVNVDEGKQLLCELQCKHHDILDLCYIGNISQYGNSFGEMHSMLWRVLPVTDLLVDYVLIRDLDSRFSEREVAAVSEWIESGMSMHMMRDHPLVVNTTILGCCWAVHANKERVFWSSAMHRLIIRSKEEPLTLYNNDQMLLDTEVYKRITNYTDFLMHHDSYSCDKFRSYGVVRPFPTQRNNETLNVIGSNSIFGHTQEICPEACRKDISWLTC